MIGSGTLFLLTCFQHDSFCWRCEADKKNVPNFLDFSENPTWKLTERSNTKFLGTCLRSPPGGPSAVAQCATIITAEWSKSYSLMDTMKWFKVQTKSEVH